MVPVLVSADDASGAELVQIGRNVWVHTSYATIAGYRTGSNGMVVSVPKGIILIDTCWNDEQTQTLLQKIESTFHKPVLVAVITHAHADRIGGIKALLHNKIKVVSTLMTRQKATAAGYPQPFAELHEIDTALAFDGYSVEVFYPGAGHTADNMAVWVPSEKILFGGCLIKSIESATLGNTADAVVSEWAHSVQRLMTRYPDVKTVVPGHGKNGGMELLKHTQELCKAEY